jgi:hypothetical protein
VIHKVVVELRRKIFCPESLFARSPSGKIRAGMIITLDQKIQRNQSVTSGSNITAASAADIDI